MALPHVNNLSPCWWFWSSGIWHCVAGLAFLAFWKNQVPIHSLAEGSKNQETLTQHHIPEDPKSLKHCYDFFIWVVWWACIIWLYRAQEIHTLHSTHYAQTGMLIRFSICENKCAWHNSSKFVQYTLHTHKKVTQHEKVQEFLAHLQWHLVFRPCSVEKWNLWRRVNQFSSSSWSYSIAHFSIPLRYCSDSSTGTVYCGVLQS